MGNTDSFAADDRGQTLQDYVVGISVFAVIVVVALGFFPGLLEGFQTGTQGDHEAQADRVGRQIVSETVVSDGVNELNVTRLENVSGLDEDTLQKRYGIEETVNLNVTVETLDSEAYVRNSSGSTLNGRPPYDGSPSGSTARIVTLSGGSYDCSPACRLVVRAW